MRVRSSGIAYVGLSVLLLSGMITSTTAAGTSTPLKSEEAYAQSAPKIAEPAPVMLALASETGLTSETINERRDISLDFHAADINDVLKALSLQAGKNIVTGTDVKGQVTVSLNRVSFREALDMITKLSGYNYALVSDDTYIIGSGASISVASGAGPSELTGTVPIVYSDPDQLGKMLETQVPGVKFSVAGGKSDQPGPKVIVFSGPKDLVDAAKSLIEQVEASMAASTLKAYQGRIVEVYRLKYANSTTMIAALQPLLPTVSVVPGPTQGFTDTVPGGVTFVAAAAGNGNSANQTKEETRVIILSGIAEDVAKAKQIIETLDVRPKQVMIETKVTDITIGDQKRLGLSWSWNNVSFAEGEKTNGGGNGTFVRLPAAIDAQLDAMFKDNNAKLLANPTIAALEGKPATIFIGDEIKYIINIQETLTGVTFQTETASVGVTLRVVARPDSDGYITLALHPEVSTVSDWLTIGTGTGGNNSKTAIALPQIARRFTDHIVRVKNGESIVIGGLIRDEELNNLTKVPLLGDLPFFGGLFRHREKTKSHSDICIFIKATVMPDL